jgi:chemotaxis protein methyltransferase CheR
MKARSVESEETRSQLNNASKRVLSVASVQQHLQITDTGEQIKVGAYLSSLCETLGASMIAEHRKITIKVMAPDNLISSNDAVSLGLIVTELVINALKHAFPEVEGTAGQIVVEYEVAGVDWRLTVADDGVGMPDVKPSTKRVGLGMTLMKALAQQLDAKVEIKSGPNGTTVGITHTTFVSRLDSAA